MTAAYDPASDPLGQSAPLSANLTAPLLGVPVVYGSNSPEVIAVAARALAPWRNLPPELVEPGPPARVSIVVHPAGPGEPPASPGGIFTLRAHGDSLLGGGGGSLWGAHRSAGLATAFVTPELTADEAGLSHEVIERLGLFLAGGRDRTPIAAAAVVRGGRALILAGPPGVGKATLCYACVRAGFALLSDESVSVSLGRGLRVWGHPGGIGLRPDAARFFPELAGAARYAWGGSGLRVAGATLGAERLATHAERAVVCFVERAAGQASRLAPLTPSEAATLLAARAPGADVAPAVARALVAGGAYRLSAGADPMATAALLAHLADTA